MGQSGGSERSRSTFESLLFRDRSPVALQEDLIPSEATFNEIDK